MPQLFVLDLGALERGHRGVHRVELRWAARGRSQLPKPF